MSLGHQIVFLLVLAIPIAAIAWTVTHEEIFREPREWCVHRSKTCSQLYQRKFFYLFTCEYCFSFYVTALLLLITRFQMLYPGWRGYLVSEFALMWLANVYMSGFNRLRLEIKRDHVEIDAAKQEVETRKPLPITRGTK